MRFNFSRFAILFFVLNVGLVSTVATATSDTPITLAKASDDDRKQKKIDKAVASYEKKLDGLRRKYLEKMKASQLSRKTVDQIKKEEKSFKGAKKALERAGADDSVITELEGKRDALLEEILAKHREAKVVSVRESLAEQREKKALEKILAGGERKAKKAEAAYEKDLAELQALGVDASEVEDLRKKRADALAAASAAALDAVRDRARKRITSSVPSVPVRIGVEKIPLSAPKWCGDVLSKIPADKWESYAPASPPDLSDRRFNLSYLENFGYFSCFDPDFELRQKWVAWFRQHFSNQFRLSEAHNAEVLSLAPSVMLTKRYVDDAQKSLCEQHPPKTTGTREEIASQHLERIALGCGNRLSRENAFRPWDLDVKGGFKSELAKAAYVSILLNDLRENWSEDKLGEGAKSNITAFVIASAVPLDAKAFEKELKQRNLDTYGRAVARMAFYASQGIFDDYTRALKAEAKKTPGLAKLAFDGPKASLARFNKEHADSKKVLETVLAIEDGMGREGNMNGCAKKLFSQFKPYAKKIAKEQKVPPHQIKLEGMKGFLFAYGLMICGTKDEQAPVLDWTFSSYYYTMDPLKGPLTAAYRGLVEGYNAAIGNQKAEGFTGARGTSGNTAKLPTPGTLPIEAPEVNGSTHGHMGWGTIEHLGQAVVKSTKKVGDDVKITFATKKWKQQLWSCKSTNKIDRIGRDGKVYYRQNCKKAGMRDASFTPKPILVPSWAAGGVNNGALVRFNRYPNGVKEDRGWVVETFASAKQKKRTGLLGASL